MRTLLIAGNWKMNKTASEAVGFAATFLPMVKDVTDVEIVLAPTAAALTSMAVALKESDVRLAAQNVHWEESGAFTGEISAPMLAEIGCRYVIVGHSERRQYFHETEETVNKRLKAAIAEGLVPIFCVGEVLDERKGGQTEAVVERQVRGGLEGIPGEDAAKIVIAYEPVWAIGTGETATPDQAQAVHAHIRNLLKTLYDEKLADGTRIQYGGSVKPGNAKELMSEPDIDGALVGGASLKADSFLGIIHYGS